MAIWQEYGSHRVHSLESLIKWPNYNNLKKRFKRYFPIVCFRGRCTSDSSMCPELQTGYWASGHRIHDCIFPDLGLGDGTLWRPDVGCHVSNQTLFQQQVVLDEMVRNVLPLDLSLVHYLIGKLTTLA